MSLAADVSCGLVAMWLIITVLAHFPPFQVWINRADPCHLIPRWNFFAPNPGNRDYYMVVRDRSRDGRLTEWRNVPLYDPRPKVDYLWHPQKRAAKIFNDAVQSIRYLQRNEGVSASGLPFTLPYLILLSVVYRAAASPDADAEFQFAIIESTGTDERALDCSFLSSFHSR